MDGQISDSVMRERYEALHKLQQEISHEVNKVVVDTQQEVLVADHVGRHDDERARMTGRSKDFRLVHFAIDQQNPPRIGDAVTVEISSASPNFVVAENLPLNIRKTPGGDAHEARMKESGPTPIMVGMPTLANLKARND
jgi:tRNA-2-methylthio-N6-dimethylallyladenosine synthase